MRYFIQFSYCGKAYHGWQGQPNAITVQQVLQECLSTLVKQAVVLVGAGRTDTGVHAKQMFAHFDVQVALNIEDIVYRINAFLPDDIAVQRLFGVPDQAHARFDALERTYEYFVVQQKNPFYIESAHYVKIPLDVEKMNESAALLLQYRDFECFSKSNTDVQTFICDVKEAQWAMKGDVLVFTIRANRFLRNMVRAIVGTLLEVGSGKRSANDVKAVINSKDRSLAGPSVPAKGLYLTKISYPNTMIPQDG